MLSNVSQNVEKNNIEKEKCAVNLDDFLANAEWSQLQILSSNNTLIDKLKGCFDSKRGDITSIKETVDLYIGQYPAQKESRVCDLIYFRFWQIIKQLDSSDRAAIVSDKNKIEGYITFGEIQEYARGNYGRRKIPTLFGNKENNYRGYSISKYNHYTDDDWSSQTLTTQPKTFVESVIPSKLLNATSRPTVKPNFSSFFQERTIAIPYLPLISYYLKELWWELNMESALINNPQDNSIAYPQNQRF